MERKIRLFIYAITIKVLIVSVSYSQIDVYVDPGHGGLLRKQV